jgi:hypothetical protein
LYELDFEKKLCSALIHKQPFIQGGMTDNHIRKQLIEYVTGKPLDESMLSQMTWGELHAVEDGMILHRNRVSKAKLRHVQQMNEKPLEFLLSSSTFVISTFNLPPDTRSTNEEKLRGILNLLLLKRVSILCLQESSRWENDFAVLQGRGEFGSYSMVFVEDLGEGARHMSFIYDTSLFMVEAVPRSVQKLGTVGTRDYLEMTQITINFQNICASFRH